MKSRATQLLDKSYSAMISAIEIYNKPLFDYREETFAILSINSWELLLKARILQLDSNRFSSICEYEPKKKADGKPTKKLYKQPNRSGNSKTINLFKAFDRLCNDYGDAIKPVIRKNLEAMVEIRDNSVHFMNKSIELQKVIVEIGTALIKNYVSLVKEWFGRDISSASFILLPLAFVSMNEAPNLVNLGHEEHKLIKFIEKMENHNSPSNESDYVFSLKYEISLSRKGDPSAPQVYLTNSPNAIPVKFDEEEFKTLYPWSYEILSKQLQKRYSNFKQDKKYHSIKKSLEDNPKYCHTRELNPGNPNTSRQKFYSPSVLNEFDKHYTRIKNKGLV